MNDNHTALLVMDMQKGILRNLPQTDELIANVAKAMQKAKKQDYLVVLSGCWSPQLLQIRRAKPEITIKLIPNNKR